MVEVICDSSFLIQLATKKIKNISYLDTEIGQIEFVVPEVVINEMNKLSINENKRQKALATLNFLKKLRKISIKGDFADTAIISHIREHGGIVATMDIELKNKVKDNGGSIISLTNDRIVLEPSKI